MTFALKGELYCVKDYIFIRRPRCEDANVEIAQ